jgi:hypothetical protein
MKQQVGEVNAATAQQLADKQAQLSALEIQAAKTQTE